MMKTQDKHRSILMARIFAMLLLALLAAIPAFAQAGKIIREKVHGVSLEKTATGEAADRNVTIYLPPSYDGAPNKRYPVVYLLHGIADSDETWTRGKGDWNNLQSAMDKSIAENKFGEMIVVVPDQKTKWFGSFYVNSAATGNWEDFTVKELVNYVDGKYRTLPKAASRGITGHSMGGYGAITLGMKHPDVYGVVYGMNPALIGWGGDLTIENSAFQSVLKAKTFDELLPGGIYSIGILTVAQAFSPNPNKPPFFADFPFQMVDGKLQPSEPAYSRWQENFPVNMVGKYKDNLRKLKGLRFDSGYDDEFRFIPVNSRALSLALTNQGIEHVFEEYNGDHRNRMWGRAGRFATEVMPYFWMLLESEKPTMTENKTNLSNSVLSTVTDEEYAVYMTVLGKNREEFVVRDKSDIDNESKNVDRHSVREFLKELSAETIEDFQAKNKETARLEKKFPTNINYTLININELKEFFAYKLDGDMDWETFYKKYPKSGGLYTFSRVGFSRDGQQALLFVTNWCRFLCGEGNYYLLKKESGEWKVVNKHMIWIS